ncbi:MAG: inositol-3-phosphate synthase, partial [Candidatus Bipolaricaulota bacterium]
MTATGEIRVAVFGAGNCASALVQGCQYYSGAGIDRPGLMSRSFAGYLPEHITFAAAFDIDARKVGSDLSEAVFAPPNCTARFVPSLSPLDCPVRPGIELDGFRSFPPGTPERKRWLPIDSAYSSPEEARRVIVGEQ